jgi:hypothetical protein
VHTHAVIREGEIEHGAERVTERVTERDGEPSARDREAKAKTLKLHRVKTETREMERKCRNSRKHE